LNQSLPHGVRPIPFYSQSFDFTCGSACSLMVLSYFLGTGMSREMEIDIWREGNLVPAMGMGRYGIAFVLLKRNLTVKVWSSTTDFEFLPRIRSRLSESQFSAFLLLASERRKRAIEMGLIEKNTMFTIQDVVDVVRADGVPLILTDAAMLGDEKAPHWVLVNDVDDMITIHNPIAKAPTIVGLQEFEHLCGFEGDRVMIAAFRGSH